MAPCQRFFQDLSDYADNELDKISKSRIENHLARCPDCAKYLKRILSLKSCLRELPAIKTTQNFVPVLHDRLRQFQPENIKSRPARFYQGRRLVPILGLGAISVLIAFLLIDQSPQNSTTPPARIIAKNDQSNDPGSHAPAQKSNRNASEPADRQSGSVTRIAESDSLAGTDTTSHDQDLDAVRSRIRNVNY